MITSLKKVFFDNKIIKINSVFIATLFWSILNDHISVSKVYRVPVNIYNNAGLIIDMPEFINIKLNAKKSVLNSLDKENLAAYIDATEFIVGSSKYVINEKNLFLSPEIKLVDYEPRSLDVKIKKQEIL